MTYGYPANNNGNVASQGIEPLGVTQRFTYDSLNRLAVAVEDPPNPLAPVCPEAASKWCEKYGKDRYGNRWVSGSSHVPLSPLTPVASSWFGTATNRIVNVSYDGLGISGRSIRSRWPTTARTGRRRRRR